MFEGPFKLFKHVRLLFTLNRHCLLSKTRPTQATADKGVLAGRPKTNPTWSAPRAADARDREL